MDTRRFDPFSVNSPSNASATTVAAPVPDDLDTVVQQTVQRLRAGALWLAVVIALSLPASRLYFGLQAKLTGLNVEVEQMADELSRRAGSRPDSWAFERNALAAVIL